MRITDSERRALRSISTTAHEAAHRTGTLLADLLAIPGLRIFQGVASAVVGVPPIPHAISAGRQVMLVESVTWPSGRYATTATGRVLCDGMYIGQSVRQLIGAVRYWRETLLPEHEVRAYVVVHQMTNCELILPPPIEQDLAWAHGADVVKLISGVIPRESRGVSLRAVAALAAAITWDEGG